MARKRKGLSLNDCPKDLNDIPYIRWMNQQIANGRHPTGLSAPPALDGQGSSAQSPSAGPSRVRRQPARTATTMRPVAEQDVDDDDEEYRGDADGTEDEEDEPEDLGMSNDDDGDDDDADDDAEEEAQPAAQPPKRSAARASGTDKGKGKAVAPPPRQESRKKRSAAPVERGLWSDKESTIFAAARWFTKDELEPLKGKQGTQYWVRLLTHIKESNPGWCRNVNALQKQWRCLVLLWREYKRGDGGSGNGSVEKPPWWPYLELYNKDTAAAAPHAVDGGGATNVNVPAGMEDMRLARERMTESAPPDVHCAPTDFSPTSTDFSPPPPRGESAPPPEAAQQRDDVGDVNTVTPGDDDVEIWVRGTDD
ncbi:unnamed protein product [Closterium sp. Naga37s-1]|nr:unnamed protein product [Closterium sp. Naga37s-1]